MSGWLTWQMITTVPLVFMALLIWFEVRIGEG